MKLLHELCHLLTNVFGILNGLDLPDGLFIDTPPKIGTIYKGLLLIIIIITITSIIVIIIIIIITIKKTNNKKNVIMI